MKSKLIIDDAIPFLEGRLETYFDCRFMPGEEITKSDLRDAEGLLVRTRTRCDESLLEGTPVKLVATATIGTDHIDTFWCDDHGIRWCNAPGCNAPAVAQYVYRALIEMGLPFPNPETPESQRPVIGVVGKGNIGSIVVDWGRRLGFNVIVSDPPRAERGLTDEQYLPLDELMARADAVTFHTPLIKKDIPGFTSTLHLCGRRQLDSLRQGAILINAARGGVVDEEALRQVRAEKELRIVLDTWENEPDISTETLAVTDLATFHIAGYSRQGKERATRAVLTALEEQFGVILPLSDLSAPYTPSERLSEASIRDSYDINTDDHVMRLDYPQFEHLRNFYPLREELS